MESKYYTPTIEEFHIGFKYQHNVLMTNMLFWWLDKTVKNDTKIKDIESYISVRKIRVKYLDKEDIESLGWEFEERFASEYEYRIKTNDQEVDEYFLTYNKDYISIKDATGDWNYFSGKIKNKSELIKLMKQIGINNQI